jgi:hypothetical protein
MVEIPQVNKWNPCANSFLLLQVGTNVIGWHCGLWQTRLGLDIFVSSQLRCQPPNKRTLKSLIKCGVPISPFVLEIILDLYETSNYPCLLV